MKAHLGALMALARWWARSAFLGYWQRIAIWQVYTLLAASAVCVARLRLRPGKQRLALAFFVVALNALVPLLFDGHTELITNLMTFINTTLTSFKVRFWFWHLQRQALVEAALLERRQFTAPLLVCRCSRGRWIVAPWRSR